MLVKLSPTIFQESWWVNYLIGISKVSCLPCIDPRGATVPPANFSVLMTPQTRNTSGPCPGATRCCHGGRTYSRPGTDYRPNQISLYTNQSILHYGKRLNQKREFMFFQITYRWAIFCIGALHIIIPNMSVLLIPWKVKFPGSWQKQQEISFIVSYLTLFPFIKHMRFTTLVCSRH